MEASDKKIELIKKSCRVFNKYDGVGPDNNIEYMAALKPIREEAKELGISLDELYKEYLKRKEIIDEANSIFTIMNSAGPKNNNELMTRLRGIRGKAKDLDIDLSSLWRKQKELNGMFINDEIDIHTIKVFDPINEEYCEAFLNSILSDSTIESRFVRLHNFKQRGIDNPNFTKTEISNYLLYEGVKIIISKIKNGNTESINDSVLSDVLKIGVDKFDEYISKKSTTNEDVLNFLKLHMKSYDVDLEHVGAYDSNYLFKQSDNDKSPKSNHSSNVYRIYLNIPRTKDSEFFLMDYCVECQKQGISFDMKMFFNTSEKNSDGTILYSTYCDINKKISILRKLLEKYPNIQFGSPPPSCVMISGIEELGICNVGSASRLPTMDEYYDLANRHTYNDYINDLFRRNLCKLVGEYGVSYHGDSEFNNLREFIKKVIDDKSLKDKFLTQLCEYVHQDHNRRNGYSNDEQRNIALDTWYLDELKLRHSRDSKMVDSGVKK